MLTWPWMKMSLPLCFERCRLPPPFRPDSVSSVRLSPHTAKVSASVCLLRLADSVGITLHQAALAQSALVKTAENNKHLLFSIPHIATMCRSIS